MAHRLLSKNVSPKTIPASLIILMIIAIFTVPLPVEPEMTTADNLVRWCEEIVSALIGFVNDVNAN